MSILFVPFLDVVPQFLRLAGLFGTFKFTPPAGRDLLAPVNADLNIWDKLTRVVIFLLFLAGLLGVAIWYLPLIKQNERMRKEILRLDVQLQKADEAGKQLKTSRDALLRDPKAAERLAREKLGYSKPGETVIRFESPVTNTGPRR